MEPNQLIRVYSTGDFVWLKWATFDNFCEVLVTYKRHNPLYTSLFSLQICADLRGGGVCTGVNIQAIRNLALFSF